MAPPSSKAALVRLIAISTSSSFDSVAACWGPPPHEERKTMIITIRVALCVGPLTFLLVSSVRSTVFAVCVAAQLILDDTRLAVDERQSRHQPDSPSTWDNIFQTCSSIHSACVTSTYWAMASGRRCTVAVELTFLVLGWYPTQQSNH